MKGLASSLFVAVIVAWAFMDLGSLLVVTDAVLQSFMEMVRTIARVAESAVT